MLVISILDTNSTCQSTSTQPRHTSPSAWSGPPLTAGSETGRRWAPSQLSTPGLRVLETLLHHLQQEGQQTVRTEQIALINERKALFLFKASSARVLG